MPAAGYNKGAMAESTFDVAGKKPVGNEEPAREAETAHAVKVATMHVLDYLRRAQEHSLVQAARYGLAPLDFNRLLYDVKHAHGSNEINSTAAIFDHLFEGGVPAQIMRDLYDQLDVVLPYGQDLETYVAQRFFGVPVVRDAEPGCKIDRKEGIYGGKELLEIIVNQKFAGDEALRIPLDLAHEVRECIKDVGNIHGAQASAMTRLMFVCSWQKGQPTKDAVSNIRRVVETQNEAPLAGIRPQKNFFDRMQDFFGVYADISRKVIRHAKREKRPELYAKAESVLSVFLNDPALHTIRSADPFEAFGATMRDRGINPWLTGDAKDTPFDASKFHLLITPEVPRGLVADAAFFLDNYKEALFIQEVHKLLNEIDGFVEKQSAEGKSANLSKNLKDKVDYMIKRIASVEQKPVSIPESIAHRRLVLEDFASRQSRSLSAFSVLLRALDAERVVRNEYAKEDFYTLVSAMPRLSLEDVEGVEARDQQEKKIEIFGSSVYRFLRNTDPHLDVPLLGIEGNASVREIIITNAERRWFDRSVIDQGPYVYSSYPDKPPSARLITPRDLLGKTEEDIARDKENFNSGAGAAWLPRRPWLNDAGDVMAKHLNSYKNVLGFAHGEVDTHYQSGPERVVAFYPSVSDAMSDVVAGLFSSMGAEDYIITSTQEYGTVTKPFTKQGVRVRAVNCDQPFDKVIKDIDAIVREEGRPAVASAFSSKTRLGGAVGLVPAAKKTTKEGRTIRVDTDKPNSYGLAQLYRHMAEQHPSTYTFTDSSQALGRNDLGEDLSKIPCDVLVASGGKALGVKNVGLVSIRRTTKPPPEPPVTEDAQAIARYHEAVRLHKIWSNPLANLTPGEGTVDTDRIAALGIALQRLHSRTDTSGIRRTMSEAPDSPRERKYYARRVERDWNLTERERVAERLERLTWYTKRKAEAYGKTLLENPEFPFSSELTDALRRDPAVLEQFGCQIVEPAHDKVVDYFGLLTVNFPNLGKLHKSGSGRENYLGRALDKLSGLRDTILPGVGPGRKAWRICVLPARHERDDIDTLFQKFERIHIQFLKQELERKPAIRNFATLRAFTPYITMSSQEGK